MDDLPKIPSILLIEDDSSHYFLISRYLKNLCEKLYYADTLKKAEGLFKENTITLILSDLRLYGSDPLVTIHTIKRFSLNVPIIVLTSSNEIKDAVNCLLNGAKDYIVKNFDDQFQEVLKLSLLKVYTNTCIEAFAQKTAQENMLLRHAIEMNSEGFAVFDQEGKFVFSNEAFRVFAHIVSLNSDSFSMLFERYQKIDQSESSLKNERLYSIGQLIALLAKDPESNAFFTREIFFEGDKCEDEGASQDLKNKCYEFSVTLLKNSTCSSNKDIETDKKNNLLYYVVHTKDITLFKNREQFQRQLLSTTIHDIKGPLGAVSISGELATKTVDELKTEENMNEFQKGKLQRISDIALRVCSASQKCINLIDEFLSAQKIQQGMMILKPKKSLIRELVSDTLLDFESIAKSRQISLIQRIEDPSLEWNVDGIGFKRVLSNLVSNALKFTNKNGSVTVCLSMIQTNDKLSTKTQNRTSISSATNEEDISIAPVSIIKNNTCENINTSLFSTKLFLSVADTGSGMDPGEVNTAFKRFGRLARHSDYSGTGLGLFIVKSIVYSHGGSIEVDTTLGSGTEFKIYFPSEPKVDAHGEIVCFDV
jgi:signal transduction histidine kinase/DNA-binding response OmpR family regulator